MKTLLAALTAAALGLSAEAVCAQSLDDARAMLRAELGDPKTSPLAAFQPVKAQLPGTWLMMNWDSFSEVGQDVIDQQCQRRPLKVAPDMTVTLGYTARGKQSVVPGRIEFLAGRMVNLTFDEDAYVGGFLGLPDSMRNDDVGLQSRMSAHRLLILTPRGPDTMVGYGVYGGGDLILRRCAG